MKLKTYTALITVSVDDDQKPLDYSGMELRLLRGLLGGYGQGRAPQAVHVGVVGGDNMKPVCSKIGEILYLEGDDTSMLRGEDRLILDIKRRHSKLHARLAGVLPIPVFADGEGSDID